MTERTGPNLCEDEGCEEQPLVHSHPPEFDAHAAIYKLAEAVMAAYWDARWAHRKSQDATTAWQQLVKEVGNAQRK